MTRMRALLAFLWLAFALTATAHAAPVDSSCHDSAMAGMEKHGAAPHQNRHDDQTAMPCCSQPVVIALPAPLTPVDRRIERVRLIPTPVSALIDHALRIEPRPPKVA